ncbi:MAG: heme utilization cystosolic carrier protein HutX [Burkholderiaceae bacterium]
MTSFDPMACAERLARNPGVLLEKLAQSTGGSPAAVIECLPRSMWQRAPGGAFVPVLEDIATWGEVTTIVNSADLIFEVTGDFPRGSVGHGFYNLESRSGLHGHLRHEHCGAIYFVRRPFMKKETASVLFANAAGEIMFKVFLGRDASGELRCDQLERFAALAAAQAEARDE